MVHDANRFFVLTGGPGSGKSSLIEALARLGYSHTVEAGRGIIQDQADIGGLALPWADKRLFAMMLAWELRSFRIAREHPGTVFFDRGVPDVTGYLRLVGEPVPQHAVKAAKEFRYNRRVFIAPPWKEIFHPDCERRIAASLDRRTGPVRSERDQRSRILGPMFSRLLLSEQAGQCLKCRTPVRIIAIPCRSAASITS